MQCPGMYTQYRYSLYISIHESTDGLISVGFGCFAYLLLRCWMLPRHLNSPFTMMESLVHRVGKRREREGEREEGEGGVKVREEG